MIVVVQSKIKELVVNPNFISILCLKILVDDEDMDMVYVTGDPCITYRSDEIID